MIWSACCDVASIGIASLSWKFTPYAPTSPSIWQISPSDSLRRVGSPNGSRPMLPTVHRPNVNFSFGSGANGSFDALAVRRAGLMAVDFLLVMIPRLPCGAASFANHPDESRKPFDMKHFDTTRHRGF